MGQSVVILSLLKNKLMSSIAEIQQEIVEEFEMFDDWDQKYEYLIELGKELLPLDPRYKIDENLIKGCQSRVWLHAWRDETTGNIRYRADSDALITKGIIALLIRVFDNQKPEDILSASTDFIAKIGLHQHLSPRRANGLLAMIKQIKFYALALSKVSNPI